MEIGKIIHKYKASKVVIKFTHFTLSIQYVLSEFINKIKKMAALARNNNPDTKAHYLN